MTANSQHRVMSLTRKLCMLHHVIRDPQLCYGMRLANIKTLVKKLRPQVARHAPSRGRDVPNAHVKRNHDFVKLTKSQIQGEFLQKLTICTISFRWTNHFLHSGVDPVPSNVYSVPVLQQRAVRERTPDPSCPHPPRGS